MKVRVLPRPLNVLLASLICLIACSGCLPLWWLMDNSTYWGEVPEEINPISLGVPETGSLSLEDVQQSAYSFTAKAGMEYIVTATGSDALSFYVNSQGDTNTNVSNFNPTGSGYVDTIRWIAGQDGTYVIRLGIDYGSDTSSIDYQLTVTERTPEPDDHADGPIGATPLALGTTISGKLNTGWDTDVFAFPVQTGNVYIAKITSDPGIHASLLGSDGGSFVGSVFPETGEPSMYLSKIAPASGTMFLCVVPDSYYSYGILKDGSYRVTITQTVVAAQDEHGNGPLTATPLTLGTAMPGALQELVTDDSDVDVFSFAAKAGQNYTIELAGPLDLRVILLGTDGLTALVTNSLSSGDQSSVAIPIPQPLQMKLPITWTAPADGTYFVEVCARNCDAAVGPYELKVSVSP